MGTSSIMPAKQWPLAIPIYAGLVLAMGVLSALMGWAIISGARRIAIAGVFTLTVPDVYAMIVGAAWFAIGVLAVAASVGLWRLQPIAWLFTWGLMWLAILFALIEFTFWGGNLEFTMIAVAVAGVILVYLSRRDVQFAFRHTASNASM
jgi:hypothetical protein